jgi:FkbM family methyltransferase
MMQSGDVVEETEDEPRWLAAAASIIRRLPRGRYRTMNALSQLLNVPVFKAPFPRGQRGLTFECNLRNLLAREVYFTGQYEPQETALIEALIKPGQTFVDVGAHWGYFSLIASQRVGSTGRVFSIEADPRLFRTLKRNVQDNGLRQVEPIHIAAAAETGVLRMLGYRDRDENWGVSHLLNSEQTADADSDVFNVATTSIDSLLDERSVTEVDVLKMDIEGAEALALRGMEAGLRGGRYRVMVIEFHPAALADFGSSVATLADFLLNCGYRAWRIDHTSRAMRRAVYCEVAPRHLLTPWTKSSTIDDWPHLLWSLNEPLV